MEMDKLNCLKEEICRYRRISYNTYMYTDNSILSHTHVMSIYLYIWGKYIIWKNLKEKETNLLFKKIFIQMYVIFPKPNQKRTAYVYRPVCLIFNL